jgi:WD40 repeat protein
MRAGNVASIGKRNCCLNSAGVLKYKITLDNLPGNLKPKEFSMTSSFFKSFLFLIILLLLTTPFQAGAKVEWRIENTLKTEQPPLDVAVSPNGQSIFVLTADGSILIYNSEGQLNDTIDVGSHIDQIRVGPGGEQLFATSRQNQTVEVIALNFIRKINVTGSPSKGRTDAQVTLTVFSDFQ